MKRILTAALFALFFASCQTVPEHEKLNAQAAEEYLKPIRPGYEGRNPFWNKFAKKFLYVPAFDFPPEEGAVSYKFTVKPLSGNTSDELSFTAETPKAPLTPIWNKIIPGDVILTVEAIDTKGKVIAKVGERKFLRDIPFTGPYHNAVRDYRDAARMAVYYIHQMPAIQSWKTDTVPDMEYSHNTYACKIVGATIRNEVMVAREFPLLAEDAIEMAKNAARFLIDVSRPEDSPLAFFPPTYYLDLVHSKDSWNKGKTMTLEACAAGHAFLDLYDYTGERLYYDRAIGIANTYLKLQREDGSLPIKVDFITGEPVNNVCAMLHPLLNYIHRLQDQYGLTEYDTIIEKGEKWMNEVAIETFNMTGQFEDVNVLGLEPYENLTNCTAAPYASYLLQKKNMTKKDLENAIDLICFSEDQFTFWDTAPDENGIKKIATPCVFEQYKYQTPVDASAHNVAMAFLDLYDQTGDKLAFAKAKALIDNMTIVQNPCNGMIPTLWDFRSLKREKNRTFWTNCSWSSVTALLRMSEYAENE
jgi:maltose/maltodextrin transport system substrate-binding protein